MNPNRQLQDFLSHAFSLADTLGIEKILIQTDHEEDLNRARQVDSRKKLIWLTTQNQAEQNTETSDLEILRLQLDSIRGAAIRSMGLILAVLQDTIRADENILCLYNSIADTNLDSLTLTSARSRLHIMREMDVTTLRELIAPEIFVRLLNILSRFALEGREGKPIGTTVVLGETDKLQPYIQQLILNPCQGHNKEKRNVLNNTFKETFRELTALDGAFLVNRQGVVEAAATYLHAPKIGGHLRSGLGARHASAAAITAATDSLAMVLSESSGNITIYFGGNELLEIEIFQEREQRFG